MTKDNATLSDIRADRFFTFSEGQFAGRSTFHKKSALAFGIEVDNDAHEDLFGPYFFRPLNEGGYECMFIPLEKHNNAGGFTHGGALMTFADFALFAHSRDERARKPHVTLQFESQFISASRAGNKIYSTAEILRKTKDLIFIRGHLSQNEKIIFSYSGILKQVG